VLTESHSPIVVYSDQSIGSGTIAWKDEMKATASDDTHAYCAPSSDASEWLVARFAFNLPMGATVLGISAEYEAHAAGSIVDNAVRIVKGGTIGVDDRSQGGAWPLFDTSRSYGSAFDLWGETWTAADVNGLQFGVALSARRASVFGTAGAYVDHVRLTVYYLPCTPEG
jgi:hypothetical protein